MAERTHCSVCGQELSFMTVDYCAFQGHYFPICVACRDKSKEVNSSNPQRKEKATEYFLKIMEEDIGPNSKPLIKNFLGETVSEEELGKMDMQQLFAAKEKNEAIGFLIAGFIFMAVTIICISTLLTGGIQGIIITAAGAIISALCFCTYRIIRSNHK